MKTRGINKGDRWKASIGARRNARGDRNLPAEPVEA
jgi:hypothetical protein